MPNDSKNTFRFGLLFFVGLIILGAMTVTIGNLDWLWRDTQTLRIRFDNVGGLKEGDIVRASGMEVGRVEEMELKPDHVVVVARVSREVVLKEDCKLQVSMSSLVGGWHVAIDQGTVTQPAKDVSREIKGVSATTPFDELGKVIEENRENVKEFIANLREISETLRSGKGTLGKLMNDPALYDDARAALSEIKEAVAGLKKGGDLIQKLNDQFDSGEGTLIKLLKSNEVYDELKATSAEIRKIVEEAQAGKGTLGKILKDEALYEDAKALVADLREATSSVRRIMDKIENGKGPAGRLLNDEEMAQKLDDTVTEVKALATSLKNIAQKIESGEGSLGKLIYEDKLYNQASASMDALDKTLGRASRTKTYVTFGSRYYGETQMFAPLASLQIFPKEDRYFEIGGVAWPAGRNSRWTFPEKVKDDEGTVFFQPTALLGFRFIDNRLDIAGGLLEGRFGGRISYRFTIPYIDHDVTVATEIRDSWEDEDKLDERAGDIMIRAYVDTKVWKWFHVHAGASRIGHDAEFFAGVTFTYEDEDIRTFISLLGLAN